MSALHSQTTVSTYVDNIRGQIGQLQDWLSRMANDKAQLRRVLMFGGVAMVSAVSLVAWLMGGRYESTDDAYIQAPKLMVSTDVSGLVKTVNVHQGDHVRKGQVLFTLDAEPFRINLQNAKAQLEQTVLSVQSMKEDYGRMLANIDQQRSQVDLAQRNFVRYASLLKANAIAPATYDQARLTLASSRDQLSSLQQAAQTQLAKLGGSAEIPVEQHPDYLRALSAVKEAQRQLAHTVVRAPFTGIVAEVDSLQPGTLVISAMSAFSTTSAVGLMGTDEVWVEAHMKETDLERVHKGDPVEVTVDTYPGKTWQGHVDAVSPVTGSAFSVLPAENASGNWVKVVQRIPVRIAIERHKGDPELRAGMSTNVEIDTGSRRWYRMLFGE